MKKTLKELLIDYNNEHDYELNEESLKETFEESFETVWKDSYLEEHRWYSIQQQIVKIGDRFFQHGVYIITGDMSASDMCLEPQKIDDIIEVFPHVTESITYKTEPQEEKIKMVKLKDWLSINNEANKLSLLESYGVDNWSGYEDAMKDYNKIYGDDI
jgi:hypothetical protein